MLATYVQAVNTPASFEDAAGAMNAALAGLLRATPATEVLALAMAKTVLEAGRDSERVWVNSKCWNVGNIKAGLTYAGMFSAYSCNEVLGGQTVWFSPYGRLSGRGGVVASEPSANPPGHPQTRFRAYANIFDGANQYIDFVASGRYRDALTELLEGDAPGYVEALHRKGYFTADPEVYGRGVLSLHKEFIARLQGRPAPAMWVPSAEKIGSLLAPQAFNAAEVEAWTAAVDAAREATREERNAQMFGSDYDETTVPDGRGQS